VRLLRDHGIDPVVLKGPTIALAAFGRYGVRYSMDIDLLVSKSEVASAELTIVAAGYVRHEPAADATAKAMRARMGRYKDIVFRNPATGIIVELHWRLFQNPWLMRGVGHRAEHRSVQTIGAPITVLGPDVGLLYMCVHGGEHAWSRLKWLADLGALLANNEDRAEALYSQAREAGIARWVGPGMLLSAEIYGSRTPDQLSRDVEADRRMTWLVTTARDSLIGDQLGTELEDIPGATTRKSLGHYLASSDIRYWAYEARYDVLEDTSAEGVNIPALSRISRRIKAVLTSAFRN